MSIDIDDDEFEEKVLNADGPVLVVFFAGWSDIWERFAPVIDEFAEERAGKITVAKMDVENNRDTAMRNGVRSVPTLKLFNDGKVLAVEVGTRDKIKLAQWIDFHLTRSR